MQSTLGEFQETQSTDAFAFTAHVWAEAAMHRNPVHLKIAHFSGMVARHVRNQPR